MGRLDELERDRQIADIQAIFKNSMRVNASRERTSSRHARDDGVDEDDRYGGRESAGGGGAASEGDAASESEAASEGDGALEVLELSGFGDGYEPPRGAWRARLVKKRGPAAVFVLVAVVTALATAGVTWFLRPVAAPVSESASTTIASANEGNDAADGGAAGAAGAAGGAAGAGAAGGGNASAEAPSPAMIVVAVVGQVVSPGLVTLPEGARVSDAISAAGGALPGVDLTNLNIARKLSDGEQIAVGVPAANDAGGASGAGGGTESGVSPGAGPINLNTATAAQLDELPGIGPVIAQRIVDFRDENGPFASVQELANVSGIGPSIMEKIKDLVTV